MRLPFSGTGRLQANPPVEGPRFSHGKPTRRAITTMGLNDLVVGEGGIEFASGMTGKLTGEARWPLAVHIGEGKL